MEALEPIAEKGVLLPLSASQREIWLDQRAWPGSTHLYIGGVAFLRGALDVARLTQALELLVAESDALRLVPHEDGSQSLLDKVVLPIEIVQPERGMDLHEAVQRWWHEKLQVPFAWDGRLPWRFAVLQGGGDDAAVVMQYHHLIMDGWGTARLIQRWSEIYNQLTRGESPSQPLQASYATFVDESNAYLKSTALSSDAAYWLAQMPTLPPVLIDKIGADGTRGAVPPAFMGRVSVPVADYVTLKAIAVQRGSTPFNYFLAALVVYFSRVTHRNTVVVGVPSLNRSGRRFRDTLGMFVGVFPVSVTIAPGMSVQELLGVVGLLMRGALRHARYPLSELARALGAIRQGRDGLFDVLLSYERQDYDVAFGDAHMAESRQLFCGRARYPLGITVCEFQAEQDLEIILEGSSACFDTAGVSQIGQFLWNLVQRMMADATAAVDDLTLISDAQRTVIDGLHQNTRWHVDTTPYITQFEHQASVHPDNVALVWDGGAMSYQELNARATFLAVRLASLGAEPDTVIALAMPRSADLVVAILAISKTGAAFLPLDVDAPLARLSSIVTESRAVALVIEEQGLERLASLHDRVVVANWNDGDVMAADVWPPPTVAPDSLAYVLFTSGSTGSPKGVMMDHAALSRRLSWLTKAYGIEAKDRSALSTQITFDPSLIELCLPLIHGASVALPPPGRLLPEMLAEFAVRHGATFIAFVPSTLSRFLDRVENDPKLRLRVACCGGEVLPPELVNRYLKGTRARLFNVYGPTEACIFVTAWECVYDEDLSVLPLGQPVDDTCIYVLDSQCSPLPLGVPGEVFIGGATLARGYLHRPDLNAHAFVPDPFRPGARMYRTGDRGWLSSDGNLHFLGRMDRQVKLRGYRIELGEIEAALRMAEGVTQAAVKVVKKKDRDSLHAWVAASHTQDTENLQRVLRVRLPDYMIPNGITVCPDLPMSQTGKIDYDALVVPENIFSSLVTQLPRNELERQLLALWEDVLGTRPLGVRDNFFDIGGDSLAAVTILTGLEAIFSRPVPLFLLTENPTIESLALALQKPVEIPAAIVVFNPASSRVPIYIAASGYGDLMRFKLLAEYLHESCDIRMLQPPMGQAIKTVTQLATIYADEIEGHGGLPGFLAGFSVGGITALETACILQQRMFPVQGLILIDTLYPRPLWGGTFFWRLFVWLVNRLRLGGLTMNGRRLGAMVNDAGLVGQVMAMVGHRPRAFSGPALLVKTSGLARWDRLFFGPWRKLFRKALTERVIPGLHGSIFEANQISKIASVLREALLKR